MITNLFILIMFHIVFNKSSNDNKDDNDNDNDNNDQNIINITTRQDFESLIEKGQSFIIEVYSPECPHCVSFMPHYKKLSLIYKDTLLFAKINTLTSGSIYKKIIKVKSLPSVFIYDKGTFYNYEGLLEVDFLYEWIEKMTRFACEEITSLVELTNLLNENIINDHGYRDALILGVFNLNDMSDAIKDFFINLTEINKHFVSHCKYYLFDFNREKENNSFLLRHNFVYSYHYQKGINTFALLDQIIWDKETEEAKIELGSEYERFLRNNWLGIVEDYDGYKLNDLYHWEGTFLIFSYYFPQERSEYEQIAKNFITSQHYDSKVLILFVNLSDKHKINYFRFFKEKGIFYANTNFIKVNPIKLTNESELPYATMFKSIEEKPKKAQNEIKRFIKAKIINNTNADAMKLLNNTVSVNEPTITHKNTTKKNTAELEEGDDSHKFLQEKGENQNKEKEKEEGLRIEDETQKTHFNTKIILLPFYLIAYSGIFFFVYKKYYFYSPSRSEQIKNI